VLKFLRDVYRVNVKSNDLRLLLLFEQLSSDRLQGGFQHISRLRFGLEFMVLFQRDTPDMVVQNDVLVQLVQILRF